MCLRVMASRAGASRRARSEFGLALLMTLGVVATVSALAAIVFIMSSGGGKAAASFIKAQPGAVRWNTHQRLTVLLLGKSTDSERTASAGSILVASVDPSTHSIRMLSIPPNLWVTIPGYGEGRISDAFADGGSRLTLLTVESVLQMPITYYAVTGPHAFSQLVDSVDGVSVHVRAPFTIPLNHGAGALRYAAGTRRLDGSTALGYSRFASYRAEDVLAGMRRQESILLALKRTSLGPANFFRIPTILNTLGGAVTTNFPYNQVLDLAHAVNAVPDSRIDMESVSYQNDTAVVYNAQGGPVFLPDWQHIHSLARHLFQAGSIYYQGAVRVVNGSGATGAGAGLSSLLRAEGVPVARYETSPSAGYDRTVIDVRAGAGPGLESLAMTVSALLQAPVVNAGPRERWNGVTVHLGRDYQSLSQQ